MTYGDSRLADELAKEFVAIVERQTATVVSGGMPDFAAYRYECGIIEGMRIALFILESTRKKLESN